MYEIDGYSAIRRVENLFSNISVELSTDLQKSDSSFPPYQKLNCDHKTDDSLNHPRTMSVPFQLPRTT